MIQRIQSLFLILASASFWSLFAFPFASSSKATGVSFQDMALTLHDHIGLITAAIAGGVISIAAILLFSNRKLQMSLSYLGVFTGLILLGLAYWSYNSEMSTKVSDAAIQLEAGMAMPILGSVLCFAAALFIKKDEKLVKSMDRLR